MHEMILDLAGFYCIEDLTAHTLISKMLQSLFKDFATFLETVTTNEHHLPSNYVKSSPQEISAGPVPLKRITQRWYQWVDWKRQQPKCYMNMARRVLAGPDALKSPTYGLCRSFNFQQRSLIHQTSDELTEQKSLGWLRWARALPRDWTQVNFERRVLWLFLDHS